MLWCAQLQKRGSVLLRELPPASGARNLMLRHPLPIHLLAPADLPASHRGHGLQRDGEREVEGR